MKLNKQKFLYFIKNKKNILRIGAVAILIIILGLSLSPDFSPLFSENTFSLFTSIQHNIHNTVPASYFTKTPSQNENTVLDKPIPSTGCSLPLALQAGSNNYMQIQSGTETRRLLVYLPYGYKNNTKHAVVLAFHGYASNPFAFEKSTNLDSIASSNNIIIVYPEGTTSVVGLRGWDTGLHPTIKSKDVLFVSNMLNALQSNLCINPQKIYATGFSNGGGFVAELACQLSNRIAAFAPISGSYVTAFKTCSALRPLPIIEFHGTKDTVVPYLGLNAKKELAALSWVSRWAQRDTCTPQPKVTKVPNKFTQYLWTGCSGNASVVHYKIVGEGHVWPHIFFTESLQKHLKRIKATQIIWNFFKAHPLPKNANQPSSTQST